jgi:glycosyltransferase involved in cell wall biosynthesis
MAELVSIGLPVRNGADSVGEVVASVLAQRHGDIEVVISDNASTDDTEHVCRELASADARVVYHRQPQNVGLLNNFLEVLRLARGTYFRWIGDDDRIEPEYVDTCVEAFRDDPRLILVTSGIAYEMADASVRTEEYTGAGLGSDDPADRAVEMLRMLGQSFLQMDPLYGLMRRDVVATIPRHNMLKEDQIYAVRLALAGPWAHVPKVMALRHWRAGTYAAHARLLTVPAWQARFATTLQARELLRITADADLTPQQRLRVRAAVYGMYARQQQLGLRHRSRQLLRLALGRR